MKKITFFAIFIGFLMNSQAQTVAVSAEKMKIFYVGVDNPITIAVEGVADEDIKVSSSNCMIIKINKGQYVVRTMREGEGSITVEWAGKTEMKKFRMKLHPNVKAVFTGCSICRPDGIQAVFPNMNFDMTCSIMSYTVFYLPKNNGEKAYIVNKGGAFNPSVSSLMAKAKVGDKFDFFEIRAICPGDGMSSLMNTSLSYTITK